MGLRNPFPVPAPLKWPIPPHTPAAITQRALPVDFQHRLLVVTWNPTTCHGALQGFSNVWKIWVLVRATAFPSRSSVLLPFLARCKARAAGIPRRRYPDGSEGDARRWAPCDGTQELCCRAAAGGVLVFLAYLSAGYAFKGSWLRGNFSDVGHDSG